MVVTRPECAVGLATGDPGSPCLPVGNISWEETGRRGEGGGHTLAIDVGVDAGGSEFVVDVLVHNVRCEIEEQRRQRERDNFHILVIPSVMLG